MTTMAITTTEMQRDYIKEFSHALGREMEVLHFGHAGRPLLVFPTSMGRFYQWRISAWSRGSATSSSRAPSS